MKFVLFIPYSFQKIVIDYVIWVTASYNKQLLRTPPQHCCFIENGFYRRCSDEKKDKHFFGMKEISNKGRGPRQTNAPWRMLKSPLSYYNGYSIQTTKTSRLACKQRLWRKWGMKKTLQIIKNKKTRDCTTTESLGQILKSIGQWMQTYKKYK